MSRRVPVGPFPHYYAIVDDEDYEELSKIRWYVVDAKDRNNDTTIYAINTTIDPETGKTVSIRMHQLITRYKRTDHKNGNGLDNRRENLREATYSQNKANTPKYRGPQMTSKYKGVGWFAPKDKPKKWKWRARIRVNNKLLALGYYYDEIEAARAYDKAAIKYFGEFANLNFPEDQE